VTEQFPAATHIACEVRLPQLGDAVLLWGPGPIELPASTSWWQWLSHHRGRPRSGRQRVEVAVQIGAAVAVEIEKQDLLEIVQEEMHGGGDVAIVAAGHPGLAA
jgi:threonine dehydrogenase-like Zn-dependent dehydrogenase